jgi:hypothetical protein
MDKVELEQRTKAFALRVVKFVGALPKSKVKDVVGYQLTCPEPDEGMTNGGDKMYECNH